MKGQCGSVLAGVLGISLAMTLSAAGFILISANTSRWESGSSGDMALHHAAESGIYMGVRWIRSHPFTDPFYLPSPTWSDSLTLTPGGYSNLYPVPTRVSIHRGPIGAGAAVCFLKSISTTGSGKDTLQIKWQVDAVVSDAGNANPVLTSWTETYFPGNP